MVNFAPGTSQGEVLAGCVKNRFAKCDPTGGSFIRMSVDPVIGKVSDWTPQVRPPAYTGGGEWWK